MLRITPMPPKAAVVASAGMYLGVRVRMKGFFWREGREMLTWEHLCLGRCWRILIPLGY